MDVSIKISEESMLQIMDLQMILRKKGIRASKKDIISAAISMAAKDPRRLMQMLEK